MWLRQSTKNILRWKLILLFCFYPLQTFAEITCHLHPVENIKQPDQTTKLDGPYSNRQQCNKENERLYQFKGRCHCTFIRQVLPFDYNEFNSNTKEDSALP